MLGYRSVMIRGGTMNNLRLDPLVNNGLFILITPNSKIVTPLFSLLLELYCVLA